jgi:NADH:ubiquinone oxidoreductase subunit C
MTDTAQAPPATMPPDAMADYVRDRLGDRVLDTTIAHGQLYVTVKPEAWVDAARLAKEDDALACDFWDFLDAVDAREDGFEIIVNLYSVRHRHRIFFKTVAPGGRDSPRIDSLTSVYQGANWSERETYDMFGVTFDGHPGLLPRILTVENFEGWPLRKDFLLSTREAKAWPGLKDLTEAALRATFPGSERAIPRSTAFGTSIRSSPSMISAEMKSPVRTSLISGSCVARALRSVNGIPNDRSANRQPTSQTLERFIKVGYVDRSTSLDDFTPI